MKTRKYEQPTLELVTLAANDILLTSGDEALEEIGSLNSFTGARVEIDWREIWN